LILRAGHLFAWVAALFASAVSAQDQARPGFPILHAEYGDPTTRYDHGVLGDAAEWGSLILEIDTCPECDVIKRGTVRITLPDTRVFEDIAPRVIDLGLQQGKAVVVVESDLDQGARLAVYGPAGLIAATPFIGLRNRWLSPVGAADLDGDGAIEIAYIDRPHLAKRLRVWRFEDGTLRHVADLDGLTNHRIGWDYIPGGIRDCGEGPEMITASADWSRVMATRLKSGALVKRALGQYKNPESLKTAMECRQVLRPVQ